jgi:predicted dehydrogenase
MSVVGRQLRWGVLGVAKINNRLKPAFHASRTVKLQAIASRSLEKSREAARDFSFEAAYGSYEELLDDPRVDAVYIPLPNSLHAEWTKKAADRGKHVLCEKPLCPTAAEAADLVAYCKARDVRLMDGFMWPHHPRTRRLKQLIDDGTIGEVRRVNGSLSLKMEPLTTENIRLQPDLGGGSLLDVGCYPVYGIRWAFGVEPASVFAHARTLNGVDIEMAGQLRFADGRSASFDCGFTLPLRGWLEIVGTKGTIRVPRMWLPLARATWEVELDNEPPVEHAIDGEDQMVHMLDDFAQAVWAGSDAVPHADEAVKTLRVLDALTRSAREGREVEL